MQIEWTKELGIGITITDKNGTFIELNDKAGKIFEEQGGMNLIGSNIMDCHNSNSQQLIRDIIENKKVNVYFVEKKGGKKLIYQSPWTVNGESGGLIEISIELPENIETKNRD